MDSISFSQNWNNKLSGKYYTTLRLSSSKYRVGNKLACTLRNKFIHNVVIRAVSVLYISSLNQFIIGLDMGLKLEQGKKILQKMYPQIDFNQQKLVLVLCEVLDNDIESMKNEKEVEQNAASQTLQQEP